MATLSLLTAEKLAAIAEARAPVSVIVVVLAWPFAALCVLTELVNVVVLLMTSVSSRSASVPPSSRFAFMRYYPFCAIRFPVFWESMLRFANRLWRWG